MSRIDAPTVTPASVRHPLLSLPQLAMDQASLDGFITRKQACDQFDISDRSIGRYLKKAMQKQDDSFLKQFRLATIDNEVIAGPHVSFEVIDRLQADGRVPTWYVSLSWMQKKFILRDGAAADEPAKSSEEIKSGNQQMSDTAATRGPDDSKDEIVELLRQQVAGLQDDKRKWEEEKREMREDARETRKLMNQMQQLMGHMQDRLLPEKGSSRPAGSAEPTTDAEVVDATQSNEPSPQPSTRQSHPTKKRSAAKKGSRKSDSAKQQSTKKVSGSIWQRDVRELLSLGKK